MKYYKKILTVKFGPRGEEEEKKRKEERREEVRGEALHKPQHKLHKLQHKLHKLHKLE